MFFLQQYIGKSVKAFASIKWLLLACCLLNNGVEAMSCSFDASMSRHGLSPQDRLEGRSFVYLCNLYKYLYHRNIDRVSKKYGDIPKVIHQIWLGSPLPEVFKPLCKTWQLGNGWTYKLWDEQSILELGLVNEEIFKSAQDRAEQADIARIEILERFGGIYVDMDFECVGAEQLETLCSRYDCVFGCEPLEHEVARVGNAFMAAAPHHPLFQILVHKLRHHYFNFFGRWAVDTTGPYFLTLCISDYFSLLEGGIVLPTTYLYPLEGGDDFSTFQQNRDRFVHPETIGIHYWAASWTAVPNWSHFDRGECRD